MPLYYLYYIEPATRGVLCKMVFLEISQNSQEKTCARINFIKKKTLAQVFSCQFCEISKNTFFTEHLWTIAFNYGMLYRKKKEILKLENLSTFAVRIKKWKLYVVGAGFT